MLEHYGKDAASIRTATQNEGGNEPVPSKSVPTVFIGLGGTGKQILMRFRKRFFDRYRKARPDHSRFLLLDTDMQSLVPKGERPEDYADIQLKAADGECIKCGISPGEYEMVLKAIRYNSDPRWAWMHSQMSNYAPMSFQDGAGTIRQAGRLSFMLKYPNIRAQLIEHIRQLHDHATRNSERIYNDRMEFVIITSLSGGTGSGMFIDLAYLIRDIFSAEADADSVFHAHITQRHTTMIAVMPTIFTREDPVLADRFKQNGYAALMEMEHFNTPRPEDHFYAKYGEKAGAAAVEFNPPWTNHPIRATAWDTCYLIDNINDRVPGQNNEAREIYQMIADYLYLDFDTKEFAEAKRSTRSNHTQLRDRIITSEVPDVLPDGDQPGRQAFGKVLFANRYGCTFSSFGLAELQIDREKINRAASYRLAYQLIQRWIAGSTPKLSEEKYLEMMKQDLFHSTVQDTGEPGISFFKEDLWKEFVRAENRDWLKALETDFERAEADGSERGSEQLEELIETHEANLARPANDGEKGPAIQTMETRMQFLLGTPNEMGGAQRALDRLIRKRFNQLGCNPTLQLLAHYQKALVATKKWSHEQSQMTPAKTRNLLAVLIDSERVPTFPFNCRKTATDYQYPRVCKTIHNHLTQRYQSEACRFAAILAARLEAFIAGPGNATTGINPVSRHDELNSVKDLLTRFEEQIVTRFKLYGRAEKAATQAEENGLNDVQKLNRKESLLPEWNGQKYDDEIEKTLLSVAADGTAVPKVDWTKVENEILKHVSISDGAKGKSRLEVIRHWMKWPNDDDVKKAVDHLANACYRVLNGGISLNDFSQGYVVDHLVRLENPVQKEKFLRNMVDQSAVYFPSIPHHYINSAFPPAYVNLLGWSAGGEIRKEGRDRNLYEALNGISMEGNDGSPRDQIGDPNPTDPTSIVLVREMTGVPLNYYLKLPELKTAYDAKSIADYKLTCHLDAKELDLPDIDLIVASEESLLRQFSPVVLRGFVLRWIRFESPLFVIEVPTGGAKEPERKPLGRGLTRIIKRAALDKQITGYLTDTWSQWKKSASATHMAVLYSALQQTLKLFPTQHEFGFAASSHPPLQNCFVKVIDDLTEDLVSCGPDGQAWYDLLKMRDKIHDIDFYSWKDAHDRVSKYIREACLLPASTALPVWQIDIRSISKVNLKTAQELAAANPPDATT